MQTVGSWEVTKPDSAVGPVGYNSDLPEKYTNGYNSDTNIIRVTNHLSIEVKAQSIR